MKHEEFIGFAGEFKQGQIQGAAGAEMQAHLDACADCARLLKAWPDSEPSPWFAPRVMAQVHQSVQSGAGQPGWLAPLAAGLAMLMLVAAFWHPERAWLRHDQSIIWRDPGHE